MFIGGKGGIAAKIPCRATHGCATVKRPPNLREEMTRASDFFVAARAHHADIGGTYAGSMGPCREIYQEGFRIPPVKIVRAGEIDRDVLALLLNNVRTPEEREGDLRAQLAACHAGSSRLKNCASATVCRASRVPDTRCSAIPSR